MAAATLTKSEKGPAQPMTLTESPVAKAEMLIRTIA
jgi:hypothetical protein